MRRTRWSGWKRELMLRVLGEGAPRALSFTSERTIWLGRDHSCEVVLYSQQVSRLHASLYVARGALFVRDHSTYGTRVNGQSVQLAVRRAALPARLEVGPYQIEVALGPRRLGWPARGSAGRVALAFAAVLLLAAGLCLALRDRDPSVSGAPGLEAPGAPCSATRVPARMVSAHSPAQAVALLRSGDRAAALHAYRTLAARDDSRAELAIVAELLARELQCQR